LGGEDRGLLGGAGGWLHETRGRCVGIGQYNRYTLTMLLYLTPRATHLALPICPCEGRRCCAGG
jgi:hypothetical protein